MNQKYIGNRSKSEYMELKKISFDRNSMQIRDMLSEFRGRSSSQKLQESFDILFSRMEIFSLKDNITKTFMESNERNKKEEMIQQIQSVLPLSEKEKEILYHLSMGDISYSFHSKRESKKDTINLLLSKNLLYEKRAKNTLTGKIFDKLYLTDLTCFLLIDLMQQKKMEEEIKNKDIPNIEFSYCDDDPVVSPSLYSKDKDEQQEKSKTDAFSRFGNIFGKKENVTINFEPKLKRVELDYKKKWKTLDEKKKQHIWEKIHGIVKNGLTDNETKILEIIAETGKFFISDISKEAEARGISLAQGKIYNIKEHLISVGLASEGEEISQISGRPAKPIYLTPYGFWLYVFRTKNNPIKSLIDVMAKEQKSVDHGVHIHKNEMQKMLTLVLSSDFDSDYSLEKAGKEIKAIRN